MLCLLYSIYFLCTTTFLVNKSCAYLSHFAWVVDDAKCILVTRVCVSVCLCPLPHAHTTARTRIQLGGVVGVPPSCALLGGFAIRARVSLLWQHSPNAKCQRVLVFALCLVYWRIGGEEVIRWWQIFIDWRIVKIVVVISAGNKRCKVNQNRRNSFRYRPLLAEIWNAL